MNPSVPKNLIAVSEDGAHVMGYYTMFTVPDRFVSASKLGRAWASEALPMELVPTNRKAVDTFKNACRSVESRRKNSSNNTTEIKVDQVEETYQDCVYQITHMVRDHTQRQIDHPKSLRVTFDKSNSQISFEVLGKRFASELDVIETTIQEHFDANSSKVPGSKVRAAVRGLMARVDAVNVRRKSGGVYFVPKEGKSEIDGLTKVLDFLYGDDAEVHYIPAANDEYQQDMVQRHLELNVSQEIDETISLVADKLVASRKMRSDAVGNLLVRRQELGKLHGKYQTMLGNEVEVVGEKLRLLDEQLKTLVEQQASQ